MSRHAIHKNYIMINECSFGQMKDLKYSVVNINEKKKIG